MSQDKQKPEPKPQLPFFAEPTDRPLTTRTGLRAGAEAARKNTGG